MPDTAKVSLDAVQMETVRRALADAIELQTEAAGGYCDDCELDGAGLCDQHAAGLTWRQEYQDLKAQLEPEARAEVEVETGRAGPDWRQAARDYATKVMTAPAAADHSQAAREPDRTSGRPFAPPIYGVYPGQADLEAEL